MQVRLLSGILFFTLLAALLVLTYYPDLPNMKIRIRDEWFRLDYLGHMGFYAAVSLTFLVWQSGWRNKIRGKLIFFTVLAGLMLGIGTEFSQQAVSGRSFNLLDMACNCLGIILGTAIRRFVN